MRDDVGGPGGGRPGGPQDWETEVYNAGPARASRPPARSGPALPAGSGVLLGVSVGPAPAGRKTLLMPEVLGMTQNDALDLLQAGGFDVEALLTPSDRVDEGFVAHQYPPPHTAVTRGSRAAVLISGGPAPEDARMTILPDVVGRRQEDAADLLARAGLRSAVVPDYNAAVPSGVVMGQEPNATDVREVVVAEQRRNKGWWIWVLLLVLLAAVVAGLIYVFAGGDDQVTVPNVIGKTVAQAETALTDAGLQLGTVTEKANAQATAGTITSQNPAAGATSTEGSRVNLVIAAPPEGVLVPDVTGKSSANAKSTLEQAGLTYNITSVYSSKVDKDLVVSQSPQAGKRVEQGTQVALSVSRGPEPPANVIVPDVTGMTTSKAQQTLKNAGLTYTTAEVYSDADPAGTVAQTSPVAGSSVAPKTQVLLLISQGPVPPDTTHAIVPDVVGMTQDEATATLEDLGFTVSVFAVPSTRKAGMVVAQFPGAGSEQPKGASVAITISTGSD